MRIGYDSYYLEELNRTLHLRYVNTHYHHKTILGQKEAYKIKMKILNLTQKYNYDIPVRIRIVAQKRCSFKELNQDVTQNPSLGPIYRYQVFIEFFKQECAVKAREYLQGQMLNGIPMDLQWAQSVKHCKKCWSDKIKYQNTMSKEEAMMDFLKYKPKNDITCEY